MNSHQTCCLKDVNFSLLAGITRNNSNRLLRECEILWGPLMRRPCFQSALTICIYWDKGGVKMFSIIKKIVGEANQKQYKHPRAWAYLDPDLFLPIQLCVWTLDVLSWWTMGPKWTYVQRPEPEYHLVFLPVDSLVHLLGPAASLVNDDGDDDDDDDALICVG